ncbi:MAG: hypothetical protein AAF797_05795 [Planctomycetota bacterium]
MLFLVIFGSLAAAMAIVSEGNLKTADSHIKVNRALSAADTGVDFLTYRLGLIASTVTTSDGEINAANAPALWTATANALVTSLSSEFHNEVEPIFDGTTVTVGPIRVGPSANSPSFTATLTPHPLVGEDYDSDYYDRPPYDGSDASTGIFAPVSSANPLGANFIRIRVTAADGPVGQRFYRSISIDYRIDKKIRFAILSRSRVMIGKNVMVEGPIGSRFTEVDLNNGHPIQIASDFRGIDPALDADLDLLQGSIAADDQDGDNRLNIYNSSETTDYVDPASFDLSGDGYIDEFDFFLIHLDTNADNAVSASELQSKLNTADAAQLMELIDTMGDPNRPGFGDGAIDGDDIYAKIKGELHITAGVDDWEAGAAGGEYTDYLQGPIDPATGDALTFDSTEGDQYQFGPDDFDVDTFRTAADGDLAAQAAANAANNDPSDPDSPQPLGEIQREQVPFGAAYPYDWYDRPVYRNMTFKDITIPKGTNALFINCRFIGVTFIESEVNNTDPDFNYAGMMLSDGTPKHPDKSIDINGVEVVDTKTVSNNLRFDNCTFEGAIVSDAPQEFTHTRNKIAFTGTTRFDIDDSAQLTNEEKQLYKRSSLLAPHYSVELGTFISPHDAQETVELSGTIVAGLADMRGQVKINGTLLTTFEPQSNTGPVIGNTSPNFNTTLGYFTAAEGDLESELPGAGWGVIQVRYDPSIPLPDGITGPIEVRPIMATYTEGGQ